MKVTFITGRLKNRRVCMRKTISGDIHLHFRRLSESGESVVKTNLLLSHEAMDALMIMWNQHRDGMK